MLQDALVQIATGFVSGVLATAVSSVFTRSSPSAESRISYHGSTHVGDNVTQTVTRDERITIAPTIQQQMNTQPSAAQHGPSQQSNSDDASYVTGALVVLAVALYANHQDWVLRVLGTSYAVVLSFLVGCVSYLLVTRVRFDGRLIAHSVTVAICTAALWLVPRLTRSAPWGGDARKAVAVIRERGVWAALTSDSGLFLFPMLQLCGLACAVVAMWSTLRFALSLLGMCRIGRRSRMGKPVDHAVRAVAKIGSPGSLSRTTAVMTVLSLLLTSGAAWSGGLWAGTYFNNAVQKLTATTESSNGGTKVCLEVSSSVGFGGDGTYTLQRRQPDGKWRSTSMTLVYRQEGTDKSHCVRVAETTPTEYRWTDLLGQRNSNVVRVD
ncbi:hypothetical protein [Luteococcus sp. OSA5]|uniref:hypothetical protein n=1 Tax=Luteococcus sp. OSA5 TaxID=3401630 RepID=UPI003B42DFE7